LPATTAGISLGMNPLRLDHVAFWVEDRHAIVARCERWFGMHVIDEQDEFSLVGRDARGGKLTFFDAEGERQDGALEHVGLRVSAPPSAAESVDLGEGIVVRLVEGATGTEYDLDHVALRSRDPAATAGAYERYGFARTGATQVAVADARIDFVPGDPGPVERPLLNHLAVLVDSAEEHRLEAEAAGIVVESTVDAENTLAVFLAAPDGVRIEYVEHKTTFSLR
jgi:catechol 2,3-dioxygenase-like lactoylglutathione lyase family enzyme